MLQGITANPNPPPAPMLGDISKYSGLAGAVTRLFQWAGKLTLWLNQIVTQLIQNGLAGSVLGVQITSATTIHITAALHHVSGAAAIQTIIPPKGFAGGVLYLMSVGTWTLVTGGNIEVGASPTNGGGVTLVWHPTTNHWHPVGVV